MSADLPLALVTGAASGIGRATATRFVADGYRVIAMDVDGAGLQTWCKEHGDSVAPYVFDLSRIDEIEPFAAKIIAETGPIAALINAAGIPLVATATEGTQADWQRVIDVNLTAPFLLSRAAVPGMIGRGGGSIVNVASVAAIVGVHRRAAYCSAKAGLVGLTRSMAVDYGPDGIRVNAVLPGTVETGYTKKVLAIAEDPAATRAFMTNRQVVGRMGTPEEIADTIAFLASPSASFILGSAIVIDGGMTAL